MQLRQLNDRAAKNDTSATMPHSSDTSRFSTSHLRPRQIDQAYTLIRELRADLTLEDWREYVRPFIASRPVNKRRRGIIVTEYRHYMRGLLSYDTLGKDRKSLNVRDVTVPLLPAGQRAARSLLQELFEIAQSHRCDRISVDLTKGMEWLAREWSDPSGHLFRIPVTCSFMQSRDQTSAQTATRPMRPNLRLVEKDRRPENESS